jgi:hypothetical protein
MSARSAHRAVTVGLSVLIALLGVAAIVRTALAGGSTGALGYVLGVGLVAAGSLRLWVALR